MKKFHANFLEPSQEQLNSLLELYQNEKYQEAKRPFSAIRDENGKNEYHTIEVRKFAFKYKVKTSFSQFFYARKLKIK